MNVKLTQDFPSGSPGEISFALRAAGLWVLVRFVAGFFTLLAGGSLAEVSVRMSILVVAITGIVAAIDARNHHEPLFLANLGTSPFVLGLLCVLPPLVGEIALSVGSA